MEEGQEVFVEGGSIAAAMNDNQYWLCGCVLLEWSTNHNLSYGSFNIPEENVMRRIS